MQFRTLLLTMLSQCLIGTLLASPIFGQPDDAQAGAARFLQLLQTNEQLHFRLAAERDPYQRGHRLNDQHVEPRFLAFASDRRYVRYSRSNRNPGIWNVNLPQGQLILTRGTQRTRGANEANSQIFHIQSFQGDRLVLKWQGRHGYVQQVYRLVKQ